MLKEEKKLADSNVFEGILSLRVLIENQQKYLKGETDINRKILRVFCDKNKISEKSKEYLWIRHRGEELGFETIACASDIICGMTVGNTHGGIVAVCDKREIPVISSNKIIRNGFYVSLEGIEDPYNFGYALRSLYAAGASGIVLGKRNWMNAAGVVCRASAGASEMFDLLFSESVESAAKLFKCLNYKIVCADLRDSVSIYDANLSLPLFLIIGGERRGISRRLLDIADINVRIDYGREFQASLSAASAATVAGFEVYRQNFNK